LALSTVNCQLSTDAVLDLLASLEDRSLLLVEEVADGLRYRMLETVREYAREKLRESGEEAVAQRCHAEFFLRAAEQVRGADAGPREEEALASLERERDNLRAALAWSQSAAGDLELGLQLGVALGWFWKTRGYLTEGREHLARLLAADAGRSTGITRARGWALALGGDLALLQGDWPSARPLLENSLSLARATDDGALIAGVLSLLQLDRARDEESLAIHRELGDWHRVGELLANLGMSYSDTDLVRARALYEEALAVFRELDSKSSIAWTLVHLHNLTSMQGDYAVARVHAEESLALFRTLGHRMGIGCSLHQLGRVAFHEGFLDEARSLLEEALQIARELGGQRDIAAALGALAEVELAQEDPAAAAAYYEQVPRNYQETEEWTNSCLTLIGLGRLAEQQGDEARAKAAFQKSLAIAQKENRAVFMAVNLEALGRLAARKGDMLGARLLAAAAAQREKLGTPVPPDEHPALERALASVRAEMGEPAFTAAWAEGASLILEQAVAEALGRIGPHGG
jgi:tetratricopeptide (TPR) repeat protein